MLDIAMPLVGHLLELSHSSVTDPLLELAPLGISKATGLARFAAHHGVDAADVIVFGDAPNDVPMFEWAGTGYAVGNAHDAVKAVATHTTESVDDDGVAIVIERLVAAILAARERRLSGIGALAPRRYCGAR
jgi:hydroxymethylpyrimidine pyrophosphatase-like HAD family hydrolase